MATQLLIYENVTPISKQHHANLSINACGNYAFAKSINAVPLVAVEFPNAVAEYPIVFAGGNVDIMPVAVLGIRDHENLYLDADNRWCSNYIPAFIRRYPYVFSQSRDGSIYTLCIDDGYVGCNQDNRGERLFDADGEWTHYLRHMLRFVNEYQAQFMRTRQFCKKLRELGLLESMQAQFTFTSGQRLWLTGFFAINRDRLRKLKDAQVTALFKSNELALIYLHLYSIRNFNVMLEREKVYLSAENSVIKISHALVSARLH